MILDNIIRFRERIFESVRRAYQTFSSYLFGRHYFSSLAFANSKRSNLEGLIDNYFDRRVRDAFDYESIKSRFDLQIVSPGYIKLVRRQK